MLVIEWDASGGVAVAGAGSPDDHVIDGVVILLIDLRPRIQKVVPESVQLGEVDAQVSHTQQFYVSGFKGEKRKRKDCEIEVNKS